MAQNNDGPGKRLRREEAKYIKPTTQDSLDLYNYYKLQRQLEKPDNIRRSTPEEYKRTNSVFSLTNEGAAAKNKLDKLALEILQRNKNIKPGTYPRSVPPQTIVIDGQKVILKQPTYTNQQEIDNYLKSGSFDLYNPSIKPKGYWNSYAENNDYSNLMPKPKPKPAPVIKRTTSEIIEPLAPRQATLTPQEIIAPVMRPVDVPPAPPMEEPVMEEETITERPVARKPPKAVMPRRQGGWSNQPLLMQLFPKLYQR